MNINVEYSEALTELDILLKTLDKRLIKKIPINLRKFIEKNKSKDYVPDFNANTQIKKEDLKLKTRELLAYIYRDYLCDEEERKEYDLILKENESRYQEEIKIKYNSENLFKNRHTYNQGKMNEDNNELIEYKNANFISKIIRKIKGYS